MHDEGDRQIIFARLHHGLQRGHHTEQRGLARRFLGRRLRLAACTS
jgi:hypothetical protein